MRRSNRGFTLVELLVVITIIAMLAGLLLPAIQSAREAGRRATCINNQGQLASAVIQYESSKQKMPGSWAYLAQNGVTVNWVVLLFPYVGRNDLYTTFQAGNSGILAANPPTVAFLQCPSNPIPATTAGQSPLSYVVNCGREDTTAPSLTTPLDYQENGVFFNQYTPPAHAPNVTFNGAAAQLVTTSMSYIAKWDGASNTLALSENLDVPSWYPIQLESNAITEFYVGMVWFGGNDSTGGGIPTPTVALNQYGGQGQTGITYARPSSKHPGGFVVAMCDGSAKYLSQDIQYRVYCMLMAPRDSGSKNPTGGSYTYATGGYPSTWVSNSRTTPPTLIPLSDSELNP